MAIKIAFDSSHNVIPPTFVLTTRNGDRLGGLLYHNLVVKQAIRQSMEMSFSVNKSDYCEKNHNANLWNSITDFKLVWCKEWNCYFEINVSTNEEYTTDKEITAISLGDAELSQINLYNIQINTEDDIARDDYEPTVLYNEDNKNASLLHRIMEKAPHYTIKHVDPSVANIQRTFSFDSKSLYDAFQEIAEEIECVFDIVCGDGAAGIERNIYVYDLENYGNDTNILLTTDALADNINYSIDTGAVKNCFRLEGGDDLMTATIRNCNPNGSGYIWYISKEMESDMSDELVEGLRSYNYFYEYYQNEYNPFNPQTDTLPSSDAAKVHSGLPDSLVLINKYNALIDKYSIYTDKYQKIAEPMIGYPAIMEGYYNTVDFYYYLNNSLMPTSQMSDTSAQIEAGKLNSQSLNNTAVQNLSDTTSVATVNSAIEANAKAIVDTRYQVKVLDEDCSFIYSDQGSTWSGKIRITNYSNEDDTCTASLTGISISGDYEKFVRQRLKTILANTRTDTIADITDLFGLDDSGFKAELKKYSLQRLGAFHDACQGCIDILIQQGIADDNNTDSAMYTTIYLPYYNKLGFIQSEMDLRRNELDIVAGKFDSEGGILEDGIQTVLERERNTIQSNLSFQDYLGSELWQEFIAYRREDTYSNTNYVSDGLGNDELFARAMEFIQTAKDEIEKSATKQHTINAKLKNLLVMKEFAAIVNCFRVGNWLRLKVDGKLFKLRLVDYQIDFENLESIDVTFSDIVVDGTEATAKDILNQAASMATSYNTVSRQARKGDKTASMVDNFVTDGLALTTTKIIDTADNQEVSWDKHGLVCREYDSLTDSYSDTQVKLINKGVYITDNNWRTAKAGIGNFTFFNPAEGEYQEAYGVIADTLVGNLILGRSVGIYNTKNSITMDEDGFVLTTNGTGSEDPQPVFTIRRKTINSGTDAYKDMIYVDSNGFVTINGGVKIDIDGEANNSTMVEMVDGKITTHITNELADGGLIESSISQTASEIRSETSKAINQWDTENYSVTLFGYDKPWLCGYGAGKNWDISNLSHGIDLYGYGHPQNDSGYNPSSYPNNYYLDRESGTVYYAVNGTIWATTVDSPTLIADNRNKYFLNQTTGELYRSDSTKWNLIKQLDLISENLHSEIIQTAEGITSTVSATYETKTDANAKKSNLESSISQTATQIRSTVSSAVSKYNTADYTITISGYGAPTTSPNNFVPSSYNGKYYLDQSNGNLYLSNGSSWSNVETLSLITDNLNSQITQTANQIAMSVSSSVSQYDLSGFNGVISVFGYGVPTASNPSASSYKNQYYLNQSNGQVYKSNGSSWTASGSPLSVISGSWQSQITANANAITSKVGTADVHTIIQQTPEDVRIAWNGISNYVSFENAAIKIKNSSNNLLMQLNNSGMTLYDSDSTLLSKLNSDGISLYEPDGNSGSRLTMQMNRGGAYYYNEGNYTGKIGTNNMSGDATIRGLTFNLETVADGDTARYMSWAYRENSSDSIYTIKMGYYTNDFVYTNESNVQQNWKKGFHFADDVYFRYDAHIGDNGYIGDYYDGIIFENTVSNSTNSYLRITGGRGATIRLDKDIEIIANTGKLSSSVDFYMNNHTIYDSAITSSSDARLKKNISSSSEKALSLLEKIDVSQFDWIETDEHIAAGFIAQQLQEIIPQAVMENPTTTRLSIRTDILIPYIVKAIQELTACIGTDNKYKNALQSIGVTTSKNKKRWEDKISLSDKNKFISTTQIQPPVIKKEKINKKIILPG